MYHLRTGCDLTFLVVRMTNLEDLAGCEVECQLGEDLQHEKRGNKTNVDHIGRVPSGGEDHCCTPRLLRGLAETERSQIRPRQLDRD